MGVFSEKTSPRLTRIRALQWLEKKIELRATAS